MASFSGLLLTYLASKQAHRSTHSARFVSTGKQPTLEERLAELISAQLKRVRLGILVAILGLSTCK